VLKDDDWVRGADEEKKIAKVENRLGDFRELPHINFPNPAM